MMFELTFKNIDDIMLTVLDLPGGTFTCAGLKAVLLFFEKGSPTQKVWFYQLNLDRNLDKTNPLNENDLADFLEKQNTFAECSMDYDRHSPTTKDFLRIGAKQVLFCYFGANRRRNHLYESLPKCRKYGINPPVSTEKLFEA
jgi:type I restriction-modification system DNA methylase subunit